MNKTSGKLAAGVRKVKTAQKTPAVATKAAIPPATPKRAATSSQAARTDLHPARIWPD